MHIKRRPQTRPACPPKNRRPRSRNTCNRFFPPRAPLCGGGGPCVVENNAGQSERSNLEPALDAGNGTLPVDDGDVFCTRRCHRRRTHFGLCGGCGRRGRPGVRAALRCLFIVAPDKGEAAVEGKKVTRMRLVSAEIAALSVAPREPRLRVRERPFIKITGRIEAIGVVGEEKNKRRGRGNGEKVPAISASNTCSAPLTVRPTGTNSSPCTVPAPQFINANERPSEILTNPAPQKRRQMGEAEGKAKGRQRQAANVVWQWPMLPL